MDQDFLDIQYVVPYEMKKDLPTRGHECLENIVFFFVTLRSIMLSFMRAHDILIVSSNKIILVIRKVFRETIEVQVSRALCDTQTVQPYVFV